jgi:hypothetical protein
MNFGAMPGANGISPVSGVGAGTPWLGLDWGQVAMPELTTGLDDATQKFGTLGNAAGNFFSTLATGAAMGADNITTVLGGALAGLASTLGQMVMWGGKGLGALGSINPIAAIIAGTALQAIGGLFRSGSSGPSVPSYSAPRANPVEGLSQGPGLVVHIDNVNGTVDKSFMDKLMRDINAYRRQGGYAEVF